MNQEQTATEAYLLLVAASALVAQIDLSKLSVGVQNGIKLILCGLEEALDAAREPSCAAGQPQARPPERAAA
jgi:hypothetical protein